MDGLTKLGGDEAEWSRLSNPATKPPFRKTRSLLLQQAPIFAGLPLVGYAEIASAAHTLLFRKSEPIFRHGDRAQAVLVLASGKAKITQFSRCGKEVILRVDGPGDILTAPGKAGGGTHSHNAHSLEACQVLVWQRSIFEDFEKRFPKIRSNAIAILNERLRLLETSFLELATEPVTQRLAGILLRLLEDRSVQEAFVARIDLTNEHLAQMIGTTLFTVNRLLSEWEKRGIVATQRKTVLIRNIPALRAVAEE
jgi:CRP/FNR family transcriptional regulator, nitrogen oxide reductase regulator